MSYNHEKIDKKWQNLWDEKKSFKVVIDKTKPKFYALVEFPYPSGQGLHVGHPRSYTALDIISRKRRLEGFNVLYPMGWDAFGLPTENFAIKNNIHPSIVTKTNISNFKKQLKSLGISFDWDREIDTTDPKYYRWTQWIFIQLFKHNLAYKKEMNVNWCPSCKVVLANEEVISGNCERCSEGVVRKTKSQWMLKITDYADRLIDDIDSVDYIDRIKTSQKNWIGRSSGAEINFMTNVNFNLQIYTTKPETIFGVTYIVIAPEHDFIMKYKDNIKNIDKVIEYIEKSKSKSDFDRVEIIKEKTGIILEGLYAYHPLSNKKLPIYISDYVLITFGSGAVMAVPAHDQRDFEFAKKFNLDMIQVIDSPVNDKNSTILSNDNSDCLINSEFLNGLNILDSRSNILSFIEDKKIGRAKINYRLRDWIFSRQRYWGEPIPIIFCEKCGYQAIDEKDLPLKLPNIDNFTPTDSGESPLSNIEEFVNTSCPKCSGFAKRETDTMPQWAGSSWYFLRYCDVDNQDEIASKEAIDYFMPVDWYNGGMEHTTLHVLYSRFWHKFLYDIGVVRTKEPYLKRTSHGMILGENGEKMSKSRGNVVNPDIIISKYGSDTMRLYEMFIGDFEKSAPWSSDSIKGCRRFLERIWNFQDILIEGESYRENLEIVFNKIIKKVTEDIENLKFNTAIAGMMTLINNIYETKSINRYEYKNLLILLNPFAPHITEELNSICFASDLYIYQSKWPTFDINKCVDSIVEIVLQINGKIKNKININIDDKEENIIKIAKEKLSEHLNNGTILKEIYIKNRLVNIVIR